MALSSFRAPTAGAGQPMRRALLSGAAERVGIAIQQADAKEQLIKLSRTDSLTGLCNRRVINNLLIYKNY